jgi:hypothetical protein
MVIVISQGGKIIPTFFFNFDLICHAVIILPHLVIIKTSLFEVRIGRGRSLAVPQLAVDNMSIEQVPDYARDKNGTLSVNHFQMAAINLAG